MISGGDDIIIEIKCSINVMCLNHTEFKLQTPLQSLSVERLSSMKSVPGIKKVEDHCPSLINTGKLLNVDLYDTLVLCH